MLTLERFYFEHDKPDTLVVVGCEREADYMIEFIGTDADPGNLKVSIRGDAMFRRVIKHIHDSGMQILKRKQAVAKDGRSRLRGSKSKVCSAGKHKRTTRST